MEEEQPGTIEDVRDTLIRSMENVAHNQAEHGYVKRIMSQAIDEMTRLRTAISAASPSARDESFIEDFRLWACKAAQLMDGFQHDEVWSDWDREVRKELSGLIVRAEAARATSSRMSE